MACDWVTPRLLVLLISSTNSAPSFQPTDSLFTTPSRGMYVKFIHSAHNPVDTDY